MKYCDTSFFVQQLVLGKFHSAALQAAMEITKEVGHVPLSELARFEVIQALRFETWRNKHNRYLGLPSSLLDAALNSFIASIGTSYILIDTEWSDTFIRAEALTRKTVETGCRALDVLHVACALEAGCREFYTFDKDQSELAKSQGMDTPLLSLLM